MVCLKHMSMSRWHVPSREIKVTLPFALWLRRGKCLMTSSIQISQWHQTLPLSLWLERSLCATLRKKMAIWICLKQLQGLCTLWHNFLLPSCQRMSSIFLWTWNYSKNSHVLEELTSMDFHKRFDFDDDGDCLIEECNRIHNYRLPEGHPPCSHFHLICLPKRWQDDVCMHVITLRDVTSSKSLTLVGQIFSSFSLMWMVRSSIFSIFIQPTWVPIPKNLGTWGDDMS